MMALQGVVVTKATALDNFNNRHSSSEYWGKQRLFFPPFSIFIFLCSFYDRCALSEFEVQLAQLNSECNAGNVVHCMFFQQIFPQRLRRNLI